MEPITLIHGGVSVLNRDDVDTDQIMPKQFLKRVERTGFGEFLFYDWAKEPGWDLPVSPILVAGRNFGCGSSREHAPWAVADYGFRVLIAPSYADIFYNNCFKNGILPVTLPDEKVEELFKRAEKEPGYSLTADLPNQTISDAHSLNFKFEIDKFRKHVLLEGLDDIGLTLKHEAAITAFEQARHPSATMYEPVDAKYSPNRR